MVGERSDVATKPEGQDIDPLASVIEAYQNQPHTPELLIHVHQAIWQLRGKIVDMSFEVTQCLHTQEELAELKVSGKRVGYLPPELSTQQSRHILGEMFPEMGSPSVKEGNSVTNDEDPSGWFDYEANIAPYLDTNEKQLEDKVAKDGRKLLSLNQYIIASQDSKQFTGQYLDEVEIWVRLGSRFGGRVVQACFYRDGGLDVSWHRKPDDCSRILGGRSSGVKRA